MNTALVLLISRKSLCIVRRNHKITSCIQSKKNHNSFGKSILYSSDIFDLFFSPFSRFSDEKIKYKYYNKRFTTHENGNVQCHDQEQSKLNSTINANSAAHTLTFD